MSRFTRAKIEYVQSQRRGRLAMTNGQGRYVVPAGFREKLLRATRKLRSNLSTFTEAELEYLKMQRTGRLATVNKRGEPQIAPVTFSYNEELDTIDIGGPDNSTSQKFRNIARNGLASFVVDDHIDGVGRGIEIRAHAEVVPEGGQALHPAFSPELIRLRPKRIISWDRSGKTLPWPASRRNVR